MPIHSELLYNLLVEQYALTRYGRQLKADQALSLPVFYDRGITLTAGAVYVAKIQDLPDNCNVACLFICIGGRPTWLHSSWAGEVFSVSEERLDLIALFNTIIGFYDRILQWNCTMYDLVQSGAPIEELVRVSLPLLGNCISITDYNLRLLVNCDLEESGGQRHIRISKEFDRIPNAVSVAFQNDYLAYTKIREPFTYMGQKENPEGENYGINLYLGNTYIGNCTLWEKLRPMRKSDFILFQQFAQYIRQALSSASSFQSGQLTTIKNIFSQLIQCFPVSKGEYDSAKTLLEMDMARQGITFGWWQCAVIQSANRGKNLPEQYVCASLEDMLPNTVALAYNGNIVCFCMIPKGDNCEDAVCDILLPYLKDMNFRTGISDCFADVFEANNFYLQALAILETGLRLSAEQYI